MAGVWTAPRTWTSGEVVTDVMLNAHVRDNLLWLGGTGGAITQALAATAVTSNPTTTSASPVALGDPIVSITTLAGSALVCWANLTIVNASLGALHSLFLGISGAATGGAMTTHQKVANYNETITLYASLVGTAATTYTVEVFWATSAGTLTRVGTLESITCVEIRR